MAILYKTADIAKLRRIHGKDRVLGFMTVDYDKNTEVLYELHYHGDVRRTHELNRPNVDFHRAGRPWFAADSVPDDAEFIGSYPVRC